MSDAAQEWLRLFVAVLHAAGGEITLTEADLDLPDGTAVHRRELRDGRVQYKIELPGRYAEDASK